MTELRINLTITALTLVVVGSIGALTQGLSQYLDLPGDERITADYKIPRTEATAPMKSLDADRQAAPASDKVAMK